MGRDKCRDCEPICGKRAAGIEAKPSEPEQTSTHYRERQVMRNHWLSRVTASSPDDEHCRERRDTRGDVNDGAAGEIERAHLMNPAVQAPNPMCQRIIDQSCLLY